MARRGRRGKMKLKKETVYILFFLAFFAGAVLSGLSFTRSGDALIIINDLLRQYLGSMMYLFPFLLFFAGMMFLRLKFFLSKPQVTIGYLITFFSMTALFKSGNLGIKLYQILADIVGPAGTNIVYIAGFFIGLILFFDTSLDQLVTGFVITLNNIPRFFPGGKTFTERKLGKEKGMAIKQNGMKDDGKNKKQPLFAREEAPKEPIVNKKEPALISDKLVTNVLENGGMWDYPQLSLLVDGPGQKAERGDIKKTASVIEKTLQSFGIAARVAEVNLGPAVTQYALEIALGTKLSKITSLANDLALATEAPTGQIRIEAPIPGRSLVGIEIPNRSLEVVPLRTMLASQVMQKGKSKLIVALGLDVSGNPVVADIAKMPHVLIAGTTGSGKSVALSAFITSILFRASPQEVKFIMIDPKRVEMTVYNGIPHLLTPVIVEPEKILSALKWAMGEMDRRYKIFAERGVRNVDSYNELSGFQALPYIVIMIDELADLMIFAPVEVEDAIARLAQMARATGIHLVIATQRPSVDVITGLIKANIPCRIAFNVSSLIDSRVILDGPGAEKLLGRGDMLYIPPEAAKPTRIQGTFVSDKEVHKLVEFLKEKNPVVHYTEEVTEQQVNIKKGLGATINSGGSEGHDNFFDEAIRIVCQFDKASASLLQRKLSIGYSRAAKILDQLEEAGVIGPAEGSKPRDVIARNADEVLARLHGEE
ncbi:MAG TPA: DNA translocase FtsK [Patescibacteria group bacterium]|nr:DNA translocase FtsK [Patescibacteria group bacterium]